MANFKHISIDGTSYDAVPAGSYVTGVKGSNESTYRTGNVSLSKTNVGLGNVPNVTTNNQTPTFSQASTRANIASGEKLSVLFGKIMKFFADLKTVAFTGSYTDLSNKPTIPVVDTTFNAQSYNAIANAPATNVINAIKNYTRIGTNNNIIPIYKNGNGVIVPVCMDTIITITGTGVKTIDKISKSSDYPGTAKKFSGTISDSAGTKMYPCVLLVNTNGNIQIRQKDVTSDTLYLNVSGYAI